MTPNPKRTFAWRRKHKKGEDLHQSAKNILSSLLVALGVLGALFITIILTFHIELSLLVRNIVYGEPIIIKKPISIVKKIPLFHNDSLSSTPISVNLPQNTTGLDSESMNTPISPSPTISPEITKVGSYTYQVRIGSDERMATPQEIAEALNEYRKEKGHTPLSWNDGLASYATGRAKYFTDNQILDEHEGFRRYVNNENGFEKLKFDSLGENSAYLSGGELMGPTIIRQLFASDIYHDNNQLDPKWTHVGVGIEGLAINVIFGGKKNN